VLWNIGNTTVRNPNRIQEGLRVFAQDYQGDLDGKDAEQRFAKGLAAGGVVKLSRTEGDFSDVGRKWRACFTQLGFASRKKYGQGDDRFTTVELAAGCPNLGLSGKFYELTPAGRHLVEADTLPAIQEVFLRQLVRYELPSPIETRFRQADFRIQPFIYLLQILSHLRSRGESGLSYVEIGAFIQCSRDHNDVEATVEAVLEFRLQRAEVAGRTAKREFDGAKIHEVGDQVGLGHPESLLDYADTTSRYSRLTGLVSLSRRSRLQIREEKAEVVDLILESEPAFLADEDPMAYLEDFYKGTSLPFDNIEMTKGEITRLTDRLAPLGEEPQVDITMVPEIMELPALQQIRYSLEEQVQHGLERAYALQQSTEDQIDEIITYLKAIKNPKAVGSLRIDDKPAYLEWAVWRAYLAINYIQAPPDQTRRFPVDSDFRPRGTAPGGGPDMLFPFENYVLVVEVTLTTSSRQEAAEGEPVRRHVANIVRENAGVDVYGLFIAPRIDNNTAETFRAGVWYRDDEIDLVNIVPISLDQFISIMELHKENRFHPYHFKSLLDRCLIHRNATAPEWKHHIQNEVDHWLHTDRPPFAW